MKTARNQPAIYVVADNCSDDTADLARRAGAGVLERRDLTKVGKPHAIEWAMSEIGTTAFDAVVIIDADTIVQPAFLDALVDSDDVRSRAAQAYFGLSNENESWLSRLAGLLARVRYEGQYVLKEQAGLNCPLTGNGMCLGVEVLSRSGWAPDALTENWELYARYTARGERIAYVRGARLFAQEARSMGQSSTQRRRWQSGRHDALRTYWRAILGSRKVGWRQKLDAIAELLEPSPVVHSAAALAFAVALAFIRTDAARAASMIFASSVVPLALWTARAWSRSEDRLGLTLALARAPIYAFWRIGLSALSTFRREKNWKRSPRHVEGSSTET